MAVFDIKFFFGIWDDGHPALKKRLECWKSVIRLKKNIWSVGRASSSFKKTFGAPDDRHPDSKKRLERWKSVIRIQKNYFTGR